MPAQTITKNFFPNHLISSPANCQYFRHPSGPSSFSSVNVMFSILICPAVICSRTFFDHSALLFCFASVSDGCFLGKGIYSLRFSENSSLCLFLQVSVAVWLFFVGKHGFLHSCVILNVFSLILIIFDGSNSVSVIAISL